MRHRCTDIQSENHSPKDEDVRQVHVIVEYNSTFAYHFLAGGPAVFFPYSSAEYARAAVLSAYF